MLKKIKLQDIVFWGVLVGLLFVEEVISVLI